MRSHISDNTFIRNMQHFITRLPLNCTESLQGFATFSQLQAATQAECMPSKSFFPSAEMFAKHIRKNRPEQTRNRTISEYFREKNAIK